MPISLCECREASYNCVSGGFDDRKTSAGGFMKVLDKGALVTVLAVSAGLLSGCGRPAPVRVCGDMWGRRLPDVDCRGGGAHGANWVYLNSGGKPALRDRISGGSNTPKAGVSYGLVPEGGVSRGGFGGTGKGYGAHGFGE